MPTNKINWSQSQCVYKSVSSRTGTEKNHAQNKPYLTNPLPNRPFSAEISWGLGNVPPPASWGARGRWLDAMLDIRSQSRSNMLMLCISAKSQTSAKSTNHIHQRLWTPRRCYLSVLFTCTLQPSVAFTDLPVVMSPTPVWVQPSGTSQNASSGGLIPLKRLSCITSNNCWTNSRFMWVANYLECLMREPAHLINTFMCV